MKLVHANQLMSSQGLFPSSFIDFNISCELERYQILPNLMHIKVFGCVVCSTSIWGKLEPRAVKCVMVGYLEGVKEHRLWGLGFARH